MSYLKELFIAKIQNGAGALNFDIETSDFNIGRRTVVHEFVQRDNPFIEDLGRKNRTQNLNGFLVAKRENDFNPFGERDFLIKIVEFGGECIFTHPFYGELKGHITEFNITEQSTKEGGLVKFTFTFIEAGKKQFVGNLTNNLVDKKTSAELVSNVAYDTLLQDFSEVFSIDNTTGFVRESAINQINTFLEKVDNIVSSQSVNNLNSILLQTYQSIQYAKQQLKQIVLGANLTAVLLGINVINIIKALDDVKNIKEWKVAPLPTYKTKSRKQESVNNDSFKNLIQTAAVIRQGEILINKVSERDVKFNDVSILIIDELKDLRTSFSNEITNQVYDLRSQYVFDATQTELVKVRTEIIQYMTSQSEFLSKITYTNLCDTTMSQQFTPLIVTAYRHYSELNDELLLDRNNIANPLFINSNQSIAIIQ